MKTIDVEGNILKDMEGMFQKHLGDALNTRTNLERLINIFPESTVKVVIGGSMALKAQLGELSEYFNQREVHDIDLIVIGLPQEIGMVRSYLMDISSFFNPNSHDTDGYEYQRVKFGMTPTGMPVDVLFHVVTTEAEFESIKGVFHKPEDIIRAKWHYTIQHILKGIAPRRKDLDDLRQLARLYPRAVPYCHW